MSVQAYVSRRRTTSHQHDSPAAFVLGGAEPREEGGGRLSRSSSALSIGSSTTVTSQVSSLGQHL